MNDRVTITSKGGVIGAVLLNNGWREVLHGQLLDDNHLLLTGTSVTRPGASSGTYSLYTFALELSADGSSLTGNSRDVAGHAGRNEEKPPVRVLAALPQRRRPERGPRANLVRIGRRAQTELSGKAFPLELARITDAGVLA